MPTPTVSESGSVIVSKWPGELLQFATAFSGIFSGSVTVNTVRLEPKPWGYPDAATKLYHHASLALQYCMRTDGRRRFTFQDTRELQIISILSDQPEICQTAQEVLGRLIEYDAASRMDLVSTVKEYIRTNYNSSLTSRNLHLHRQSLLYRLEKIQDLTGLSLSDHKDLFLLEVYVRICFGL